MTTIEMPQLSTEPVRRAVALAVNGFEVARYGGLRTDTNHAPYDLVAHQPVFRLRHYYPDAGDGQPVLLVPPLMQVAEVWDISPETSAVAMLHRQGIDTWVVDFGDPAVEPGGAERNFSDHVLAVAEAITRVREITGKDVHIGGYSQGGIFCYLAAAYLNSTGVASIFGLGSPVENLPIQHLLPERLYRDLTRAHSKVLERTGLPRWAVQQMFNWSSPQRTIKTDLEFLAALHDRESLLPREPQRKFLKRGAWIGWSGPAIAELVAALSEDRLVGGGIVIGDRTVGLADITCPILAFIGEADPFATPSMVRRITTAAPNAELFECVLPVGHFGLPVSSHAKAKTWPGVAAFVRWSVDREAALPDYIHPMPTDDIAACPHGGRGFAAGLTYGAGSAVAAALALPGATVRSGRKLAAAVLDETLGAVAQLPRLVRLERLGPDTRVSYGGMLDDAARTRGGDVAFLFQDRAHTHAAAKIRIDNVVRGLLSVGVRRGEHVGVLMDMRPSALVTVAALNRIGAVAVLLRPGDDAVLEAKLGQITKAVTDPEDAAAALRLGVDVFVLGGGAERDLPPGVVDLERIDPDTVEPPAWYRPNPGTARDLAYVLFTGHGAHIRADRISNGRWATSALAAAAAAALTPADTVYSISPLHHASGLLLTTAAPVASGARLAMASEFDPATFWAEVRRYGVTVVPYTWAMLHPLVTAPAHPAERDHPIRLFVGSGLPAGLWRRVEQRFGPGVVLELYASTRSDAILGNVSDRKVGATGRPLPGTPEVRVVAYDPDTGRPRIGADGYARPAGVGETGLLLVQADPHSPVGNEVALRGVFARDDAWLCTGDLFRVDTDGDLWYVDSLAALITTANGVVSPRQVEQALGELDAVDLAVCHPVVDATTGTTRAEVVLTTMSGRDLTTASLNEALQRLDRSERPDTVRVVESMPMTSWFRPRVVGETIDTCGKTWRLNRRNGRHRAVAENPTTPNTAVPIAMARN
ncbi:MAG TPA: AMP-binding protein [Aldersonia sp.]